MIHHATKIQCKALKYNMTISADCMYSVQTDL